MFSITLFILSICSELRSNILWVSAKEEKNPEYFSSDVTKSAYVTHFIATLTDSSGNP